MSARIPSTPQAQIAKAITLVNTGKYAVEHPAEFAKALATNPALALEIVQKVAAAEQMLASAFSGGNPLSTIIGALGGLDGLKKIAGGAQGLLGPLTGSFGAATAIAGMMRGMSQSAFAGIRPPPIPRMSGIKIPNIQGPNISNILGVTNNLSNIASVAASITRGSPASQFAVGVIAGNVVGSLVNSSIEIPGSVSLAGFNNLGRMNPGMATGILNGVVATQQIARVVQNVEATVLRDVNITSPNYNIGSLINSSIQVAIPAAVTINNIQNLLNKNTGVGYNVTGTVYRVNR